MESLSKDIQKIFQEVFQCKDSLDVDVSLESMGFDSLKLTVLQYKISELGYDLDPNHLDLQKSIKEIEQLIDSKSKQNDDSKALSTAEDKIFLSPGQNWFLGSPLDADSWNVIQIFEVSSESFDFDLFKASLVEVVKRHEMLRARFLKEESGSYLVEVLSDIPQHEYLFFKTSTSTDEIYGELVSQAEERIRCGRAPLFDFTVVNNAGDGKVYIIFLMHHLIADVYSISLFFREISSYYQHYSQSKSGDPNLSPDSYRSLLSLTKAYVNSDEYLQNLNYWKSSFWKDIPEIPFSEGKSGGVNNFGSKRVVHAELTEKETASLSLLPKYLKCESLMDVLLFAFSQAFTGFSGGKYAQVIVVDSGRSYFRKLTGINTSNILGWLALSSLTLVKRSDASASILEAFEEFKKFIDSSPDRGFGYNLQYLLDDQSSLKDVHAINDSQKMVFNYMGEVDFDITHRTLAGKLKEIYNAYGLKERDVDDRACCFRIAIMIREGRFMLNWEYGDNFHSEGDIKTIADDMLGILRSLINICHDSLESGK